mgnify:CR=1 FL=1|jgi:hypothetical protein
MAYILPTIAAPIQRDPTVRANHHFAGCFRLFIVPNVGTTQNAIHDAKKTPPDVSGGV